MISYSCDKCGAPFKGNWDSAGTRYPPGHTISPGWVGTKMLCDKCWNTWGEWVRSYFREA